MARTTKTPRKEGLFGFNRDCDFSTIQIIDNVIECKGQPRPLLRNDESYEAIVQGNTLLNVSDTARLGNQTTRASAGLEQPLSFTCGVHGELTVDGWNADSSGKQP